MTLPTSTPAILAVGGGKGGAGRSTLALCLALAAAQQRRRVVLVDADLCSPTLHLWLGLQAPPPSQGPGIGDHDTPLGPLVRDTHTPGLGLLTLAHHRGFPYVRPKLAAPSLALRLETLAADLAILDLPAGHDPLHSSLFAQAHLPVLLASPAAESLSAATQFLRAALFHRLGQHEAWAESEDELLALMRAQPLDMDRLTLAPPWLSPKARQVAQETSRTFSPHVLLSSPDPADATTPTLLSVVWRWLLGIRPRPLGRLPRVPTPRLTEQGLYAPDLLPHAHALLSALLEQAPLGPLTRDPGSPHDLLGLDDASAPAEARLALEHVRASLERPPLALRLWLGAQHLAQLQADLEDALRPDRPPAPLPTPPAPPPAPTAPHAGELLRRHREQRGVSLRELSLRTKIPLAHLEIVENLDRPHLPKPAWLRGYLREIAQVLQLDEAPLLDLYMSQL